MEGKKKAIKYFTLHFKTNFVQNFKVSQLRIFKQLARKNFKFEKKNVLFIKKQNFSFVCLVFF